MPRPTVDEAILAQTLKDLVAYLHDLEDAAEVNELRRVFRRHVPLHLRSYVAGILLKHVRQIPDLRRTSPGNARPSRSEPKPRGELRLEDRPARDEGRQATRADFRTEARQETRSERPTRVEAVERRPERLPDRQSERLPDRQIEAESADSDSAVAVAREDMTTIFIGIGRTRKVYPRDLQALLQEQCGIDKDNLGAIKILDNYSFVEVTTALSQAVIDKLNNSEFRGRTLSVNFAKKRD